MGEDVAVQIETDMNAGEDIKTMTAKYPDAYFYEIELSTLNTEEGKSGAYYQRWLVAEQMQAGEISDAFAIGDNRMILRCLNREEDSASEFEDIKGVFESDVLTQRAKDIIAVAVNEAEITFEHEWLEDIALEVLE